MKESRRHRAKTRGVKAFESVEVATLKVRGERGSFTMEMVLLLPLSLVLLFLILEFGRVFWQWLVVTNAAREGARFAITQAFDTSSDAAIRQRVVTAAQGLDQGQPLQQVACSSNEPPNGSNSCIAITRVTCPNASYAICGTTTESVIVILVRYRISAFTPVSGTVPFVGQVKYPGTVEITGLSTMRAFTITSQTRPRLRLSIAAAGAPVENRL